ncbi:glycosyltransferase family 4 protein [Corynebacterium sp. MSK004]|uniref:glycosyltransferase family 4 protein n=1 Tax=Corynebacterium sp. MSK004 TaxID=3050186 RepID=UPI002550E679|nr:glycosyltransferase family 4 protein [Corynebacterium sp. MSK004]MDK8897557.1 glycosyltransferase family 4 protein [Corynebacterium sp. MSK004]
MYGSNARFEDFEYISRPLPQTIDSQELLTRLLNENAYLRKTRKKFSVGEGLGRVSQSDLQTKQEYCFVRQYLRENIEGQAQRTRHLVLANEYPSAKKQYANGFIHRRVKLYQKAGLDVDVVAFGKRVNPDVYIHDGVPVLAGYVNELVGLLSSYEFSSISVHFMNSEMWYVLKQVVPADIPFAVFVHGYEVRNWSRLPYGIRNPKMLDGRIERSLRNEDLWKELVATDSKVDRFFFVSDWWRTAASEDLGVRFDEPRSAVVHNVIDGELFQYEEKDAGQRFKFLWVRSAHALNYGADIAAALLRSLKNTDYWSKLEVTIVGDGNYFSEFDDFRDDPNVEIKRGFVSQEEVAELHKKHGFLLVPSRFDTQGVSRDEGMSSGLIPVTNPVTAIPEFIDDSCAIQFEESRVADAVDKLIALFEKPEKFLEMSKCAAQRVRRQCGPSNTVAKELEVLESRAGLELK